MSSFWKVLSKQEQHLAFAMVFFCSYSATLFYINQKDIFIFVFYFCVVLITLLVVTLSAWILDKIPYIPRLLSAMFGSIFIAMLFGLPLLVATSLVVAIVSLSFAWITRSPTYSLITKLCALIGIISTAFVSLFFVHPEHKADQSLPVETQQKIMSNETIYPYEFEYFTYGSGTDINRTEYSDGARFTTQGVNAEQLVDNWQGFSGWYRSYYWGFDLTNLPLNAHVWMPKGSGKFPMMFIVHGDHAMQDYSELGYAYLAEHLAQLGYVVVSLDQNFLNRSWSDLLLSFPLEDENDARAWLMLEHAKVWQQWNQNPTHPLFGKVDTNNITLAGHSRGGEAAAVAAAFSQLNHLPEDPNFIFNYDFTVKSVIAIAPVDGQYRPNNKLNRLKGINYLLLQGSQDGEMHYAGAGQYARPKLDPSQAQYKFAHYIYGANHGQFNSSWGRNDQEFFSPYVARWNLAEMMPSELQQSILKHTIADFLALSIKQDKTKLAELTHPKHSEPHYPTRPQFSVANYMPIETFEAKDINIISKGLNHTKNRRIAKGSFAQQVKWQDCKEQAPCLLTLPLSTPTKFSSIQFDLANNLNKEAEFAFAIEFNDDTKTSLSQPHNIKLPPRLDRVLRKSLLLTPRPKHETVFSSYNSNIPAAKLGEPITAIHFIFKGSGNVYLDNISGIATH
jgi:dienelactone hydrolase